MVLRYLSVCSGIEAATQAWHPLDWQPVAFSEIEPFPCAVLAHHYPNVPNWGDMTKFQEWPDADVDVLCGGTPCQSFSVAGLRKGLADPRGNLMLTFGAIAGRYRPRWLVWENVPGVLSSNEGRDFGAFLGMLGELGYGFAYRVLDAQHVRTRRFPYAVPQRRRRVFVVGYLGDWRCAAAVLFDRESLSGHPAPSRQAGQEPAGTIGARTGRSVGAQDASCGHMIAAEVAPTLNAAFHDKQGLDNQHINGGGGLFVASRVDVRIDAESETLIPTTGGVFDVPAIAGAICRDSFAGGAGGRPEGAAAGHFLPISFGAQNAAAQGDGVAVGFVPALDKSKTPAVAFDMRGRDGGAQLEGPHDTANIRAASGGSSRSYVAQPWAARRLTPTECERLQAFPDDFTRIPYRGKPAELCPDGPRYKALGNSWAVNCAEWIGERIAEVDGWGRTALREATA
jgi:DNA (cytosine-5)-methyltransferase 1